MIVYQHDYAGMYQGNTTADESPLEPEKYLMPARCVTVAPPAPEEVPEGKWPRWNGSSWDIVNAPVIASGPSAVEKLEAFLAANPDVAELIS